LARADSQSDSQSQALNTASICSAAARLTAGRTVEYVSIVGLIWECPEDFLDRLRMNFLREEQRSARVSKIMISHLRQLWFCGRKHLRERTTKVALV